MTTNYVNYLINYLFALSAAAAAVTGTDAHRLIAQTCQARKFLMAFW